MPETRDGGWLLDDEMSATGPYGRGGEYEKPIDPRRIVDAPKPKKAEPKKRS